MICPQLPSALARLGLNGLISRVAGGRLDLYGLLLRVALCVMLAAGVQAANAKPGSHQNTGAPVQPDSPTDTTAMWSMQPRTKANGQRWRIGYIESGVYSEYPLTLRAVIDGLEHLGWLQLPAPMPGELGGEALWHWLGQNAQSDYLQFVTDAYWRPGNFDSEQREPVRNNVLERISTQNDLDLMIAMGTWAGQDMRAIGPPIPTVVTSTSDALSAGIVDSIHDSGLDNLHARVEPERYQRQLRLFHDIAPFESLGIVYENSDAGRTYVALDAITQTSQELGFKVVHCHAVSSNITAEQAVQNALGCYQELADQHVDAVYITSHQGVTQESVVEIARILREAGIPSFSMSGADDVQRGVLLSLAQANVSYVGLFHAEAIARIFNGALPRQLDQVWIDPAKIALNLETARIIGFDPPIDILLAADEVYE